jgi:hypothetical protein
VGDRRIPTKKNAGKFEVSVDPRGARSSLIRTEEVTVKKFLCFIRHTEAYRESPPPASLMEAMGPFIERSFKEGKLVDTGGLLPSKDGARIRLANGTITVKDGPFTESKEVIGGWAILQAETTADAIRYATEFMELHRTHWPEFDGECEVRPMFDPGMGP